MTDAVRLYVRYASISARSQMQYRASFVMETIGQFGALGTEFIGILVLFSRFDTLEGWSLAEVAFLYSLVHLGFAFADTFSRGFDSFGVTIRLGDFDRLLLRPRSTALQLAGQEIVLRRLGRLVLAFAVIAWATTALDVDWTAAKAALTVLTVVCGAALFAGLMILHATLAFWTTETLEMTNIVTHGGVETTQFPLSIYRPWFRGIFTFVFPLGAVSYFPALAILGKADPLGSPLWFLLVCLRVWGSACGAADWDRVPAGVPEGVGIRGAAVYVYGELTTWPNASSWFGINTLTGPILTDSISITANRSVLIYE